ncbi:MAG: sugar transferase [Anaerolineales bacterium]|jgi:lipopolysaccharide/colanic/teichoic acid biosynthesis glycosyltransferase
MVKQSSSLVDSNSSQQGIWGIAGRPVISGLITLVLVVLTWLVMSQLASAGRLKPGWAVLLAALMAAMSLAVERSLLSFPLALGWRYRSALLGSVGIFLVISLGIWISNPPGLSPWMLFPAILGSFVGCILATQFNEGIWENNSPPSQEVMQDVYQKHLALIGHPGRVPLLKRTFDILLAAIGLILSLPVWFLGVFVIWVEDPGPLLFVKNSVGRGGMNFHQFKLRTMVRGAEDATGPVLASEKDERVLGMGYLLRKTALDELPQLLNILKGEMSFVGPRPQRTVLVQGYLREMPEYAQRHQVLPGLAGLAQVAGDYYLTPRQKLRFDRLYIKYTSLGFDLKLIFLAFMITFWYRWQRDWDGRLPRGLLRLGSKG